MKTKARVNNVIQGGMQGTAAHMNIAANAKMFKTLTDSLYKDKPGTIVRELVCNAVDAHIAAGKHDVPVEVHVPDTLEPWFSVKDEGIGLSDEDIRGKLVPVKFINDDDEVVLVKDDDGNVVYRYEGGIYNTMGSSTKDQSNDAIGAFGLGSKTPLAYTDQFSFISIHGGMRRVYVAVINNEGMPEISLQDESPSDEHPGMEVTMAVEAQDCAYFREAIIKQLRFLSVKPKLTNNLSGIEFPDIESRVAIRNEYGTLLKPFKGYYTSPNRLTGIWIVQGGVGYSLDIMSLRVNDKLMGFIHSISIDGAILEFPIGEIEVTASREGVSYDSETINNIIKRLQAFAKKIADDAIAELKAASNSFDVAILYNEYPDYVKDAVSSSPEFDKIMRGRKLSISFNEIVLPVKELTDSGYSICLYKKHPYYSAVAHGQQYRLKKHDVVGNGGNHYVVPRKNMMFVAKDTNKKPVARLRDYAETNNYPQIVLISKDADKGEFTQQDTKVIADALDIDGSSIMRLSSFKAPANKGNFNQGSRPRAYRWSSGDALHNSMSWVSVFTDIDDLGPAVYVPMDRHEVMTEDMNQLRLVVDMIATGILNVHLYSVSQQTHKRIVEGKIGAELLTPAQAIDTVRAEFDQACRMFEAYTKYDAITNYFGQHSMMIKVVPSLGSVMETLLRRKKQLRDRMGRYFDLRLAEWCKYADSMQAGRAAADQRMQNAYERYPMMKYLSASYNLSDEKLADIDNYIEMMDAQKGA